MQIEKVMLLLNKKNANPNNYRSISLLCHFDNIIETYYAKDTLDYLSIELLYRPHWEFKTSYSTAIALLMLYSLSSAFLMKGNYMTGNALI